MLTNLYLFMLWMVSIFGAKRRLSNKDLCTTSEHPISIVFGPAWRDDATERSDYWFPDLTEECWSIECQD